ncbi:hypothetical protein [Xanthomonas campestris]|uniref:hypothetical protein n=1 Tax=Xanthomonas campestris TaxID=339 RepID=UPI000E1EEBBB|nr:hypothetical protein [Xanthomonas campestris]
MSQIRIAVDADNLLGRQFSALEREQLPYAVMQACNATAYEIREVWKRTAPRVFDRPAPLTINAAMYRKATRDRLFAEIFLRDEAFKGTPPAKYLRTEVEGGQRRKKGFEVLLQQKGLMPAGTFAVAGRGAKLDAYGNVPGSTITTILSQLRAQRDAYQWVSKESRKRLTSERSRAEYLGKTRQGTTAVMRRTVRRGGRYFEIKRQRGKLAPGIYERIGTGFGGAVRSVFVFTARASYTQRYDIFGLAQRTWDKLMPFYFNSELDKALRSAIAKVSA